MSTSHDEKSPSKPRVTKVEEEEEKPGYRCLCSVEGGYNTTRLLTARDLTALVGMCRHFDINITTMPLAQRPPRNLKLLFKCKDASHEDIWVRLDLPPKDTAELLRAILQRWEKYYVGYDHIRPESD